jgi:hypothetical protein
MPTEAEIRAWLTIYDRNYPEFEHLYTIENEVIYVLGSVDISNRGLTQLPYKFGKVSDEFNCVNNELSNFKNFPDIFYIICAAKNPLTDLGDTINNNILENDYEPYDGETVLYMGNNTFIFIDSEALFRIRRTAKLNQFLA